MSAAFIQQHGFYVPNDHFLGGGIFAIEVAPYHLALLSPPSFSPATIPDKFHVSFLSEAGKGLEAA
jgi:hypothetical protein